MAIALVHEASASAAGSVTTLTVTVPSTTAGNCLVVVSWIETVSSGSLSSVKLGGAAGNFAILTGAGTSSLVEGRAEIWADPNCAGGQTSVVLTNSTASAGSGWGAYVYEFSGIAASSPLDKSAGAVSVAVATPWSSGATAATALASELWVGVAGCNTSGGFTSMTGPSSPWVNETFISLAGGSAGIISGYQIAAATGAATYNGTAVVSGGDAFAAVVATLKGAVQPAAVFPYQSNKQQAVMTSALW